ncbi:MAG: phenylacetate-CoA oxygenase subunit PaaI, partial [Chloroflexota bacterium]
QDGLVPASKSLLQAWEEQVSQHLKESGLEIPEHAAVDTSRELHTANFDSLIDDMQSVARLDPDAKW